MPWRARHLDGFAFAAIFLLALAVRLLCLQQLGGFPLFDFPLADSRVYLEWARQIVAGDLWSRSQGAFYQAPLYPYFLAAVSGLAGESLAAIRLAQALIGALGCGLLTVAGRLLFDRPTGVLAGVLLALYAPAVFTESLIQKEALAVALAAALLLSLALAGRREPVWPWLAAGVALGALSLLRENALLLAPVLAGWLLLSRRDPPAAGTHDRGPRVLAFLTGMALVLVPVAVRNAAFGGGLALTTSQAGPNFYIGNHAGATGSYVPLLAGRSDPAFERRDATELAEQAEGRKLAPGEVSSYWLGRALAFAGEEPGAWLALLARKAWMVMHRFELADTEDLYLFRQASPLLTALSWLGNLGVLLPLAVGGVVLTWSRRRELAPLYLTAATLLLSVALAFVFSRYRLPAVPALALLAAAGLRDAWLRARAGKLRSLAPATLAVALVAVPVNWPAPAAWRGGTGMAFSNLGAALAGQGRLDEAISQYEKALALTPDLVEGQLNLGSTLLVQGRVEEALPHLERAAALQPADAEIELQLAFAHERRGDRAAARTRARHALELARRSGSPELAARAAALLRTLL